MLKVISLHKLIKLFTTSLKLTGKFSTILVLTIIFVTSAPPTIVSPVARAISECDKFAVDKGSILTDNEFCDPCGETETTPTTAKIYVLGDSLTKGMREGGGLQEKLEAKNWSVTEIEATNGFNIDLSLPKVDEDESKISESNTVLIGLGTNRDVNFPQKVDALVNKIKGFSPSVNIKWFNTADYGVTRSGYSDAQINTIIDNKATELGYSVIDWKTEFATNNSRYPVTGDALHQTPEGYQARASWTADQVGQAPTDTGAPASSDSVTDLAQQMLDNPNITYWTTASGDTKDVVVKLSQGQKAYTTAPNAPNAEVDINSNILRFILEVGQTSRVTVNALTDKTHSNNSNHYKGLAVDLEDNVSTSITDPIATKYGGTRNDETSHWHYDFTENVDVAPAASPTTGASCCPESGGGGELSQNIPKVWRDLIAAAAPTYPDVDPNIVAAVLWVENRGWPEYKTSGWGVSSAAAQGPWQFIPSTWASMGTDGDGDGRKDPDNPADAVHAAFKHHLGSAGKPIAEEFDGDAESSYQKIVFRRNDTNLLYYAAKYNGSGAPDGVKLTDFPRGQNADYVRFAYYLLATDFRETFNDNFDGLRDAWIGPAAEAEGGGATAGGTTPSANCEGSGGGAVDGFPLDTTKQVLTQGVDGAVWCYISNQTCKHHDYDAADIHAPTGTKVIAAQAGRVVGTNDEGSSNGSSVTILGSDNFVYYYAHLKQGSLLVEDEQDVTIGQDLGVVGTYVGSQRAAPHLHFDMQPPPATNRPNCSGGECSGYTWVDVQPILWPLYERLQ